MGFRAPDNLGSDNLYTLPNGYGTAGYFLGTDGGGGLTWSNDVPSGDANYIHNQNLLNQTADWRITGSGQWGGATSKGFLSTDQGSSLELGGTGSPYIDLANATGDDFDARIQLTGDDLLSISGANVGIGTSSPSRILELSGTAPGIKITDPAATGNSFVELSTVDGGLSYFQNVSGRTRIYVGGDERMTFLNGGNVGIGTTTPLGKLHVETGGDASWNKFVVKTTSFWGDGTASVSETAGTQYVTIGAQTAGIMINNPHVVWNNGNSAAAIRYGRSGGISTGDWWEAGVNSAAGFHIRKTAVAATGIDILSNGNVGIGTTGPSQKVDVIGAIRSTGYHYINSDNPTIVFQDTDHETGMIHMNSNLMHFLSGSGNNTTGWLLNGSVWPLTINMTNDVATFGGQAHFMEGSVGIGTNAPSSTLDVHGQTTLSRDGDVECCSGGDYTLAIAENQNSSGRKAQIQFHNGGFSEAYMRLEGGSTSARKFRFGDYQNENTSLVATQGVVNSRALAVTNYQLQQGPGTGNDNQWHTVVCTGGYAMVNFSVYSTSRWDGDIRTNCADLSPILTSSGWYWQNSQFGGGNTDNQTYVIQCPANYLASGFQMYATGQLDYYPQLLCAPLNKGAVSTNTFESAALGPWNTGKDDETHWSQCPAGTYVNGMVFYVSSHADGALRLRCTGISMN